MKGEGPRAFAGARPRLLAELFLLYALPPLLVLAGALDVSWRWAVWAVTGLYLLWLWSRLRFTIADFGLASRQRLRPVLLLLAAASALLLGLAAAGWLPAEVTEGVSPLLVATFYLWISVPLQEIFFRGFFFWRYEGLLGSRGAALAGALLFGFYHVIFGLGIGVLAATAAGLVLALVFLRTRDLALSWAVHAGFGVAAYTLGMAHHFTTLR